MEHTHDEEGITHTHRFKDLNHKHPSWKQPHHHPEANIWHTHAYEKPDHIHLEWLNEHTHETKEDTVTHSHSYKNPSHTYSFEQQHAESESSDSDSDHDIHGSSYYQNPVPYGEKQDPYHGYKTIELEAKVEYLKNMVGELTKEVKTLKDDPTTGSNPLVSNHYMINN